MECSQRNGRIDGYRLSYYPTLNKDDMESILINGSNTNTFTIVGLQPSTEYILNLTALGRNYTLPGNETSVSESTLMPEGKQML